LQSQFVSLPADLHVIVLGVLSTREALNVLQTCKVFYKYGDFDPLWKHHYRCRFKCIPQITLDKGDSWKRFYAERILAWKELSQISFAVKDQWTVVGADKFHYSYSNKTRSVFMRNESCGVIRTITRLPPIPMLPGYNQIGYFEVIVLSDSEPFETAIGVCRVDCDLQYMPGWQQHSWGYHADDGFKFYNDIGGSETNCTGKAFGPTWTEKGSIVGCGYNYTTDEIFWTLNGKFLGIGFQLPKDTKVAACAALHSDGEILLNFGQLPFKFDVDKYICKEALEVVDLSEIDMTVGWVCLERRVRGDTEGIANLKDA